MDWGLRFDVQFDGQIIQMEVKLYSQLNYSVTWDNKPIL